MLQLGDFQWPNDPEKLRVTYQRIAKSETAGGTWTVTSEGHTGRVFTGEGIFYGENAYAEFLTLAGYLNTGTAAELVHPHWPRASVLVTDLTVTEESRNNFLRYEFRFVEMP